MSPEGSAPDDIIGMREMIAIFGVTDGFGIDRERISVPLAKEGRGAVTKLASGEIEIVVPLEAPIEQWLAFLGGCLQEMGFAPVEEDE